MAMPATMLRFSKTNDYAYKIYLAGQKENQNGTQKLWPEIPRELPQRLNCLTYSILTLMTAILSFMGKFLDQP